MEEEVAFTPLNRTQTISMDAFCEAHPTYDSLHPHPHFLHQHKNLIDDLHESYRQILAGQNRLAQDIDNLAKGMLAQLSVVEKILKEVTYDDEDEEFTAFDDTDEDEEDMEIIPKKQKTVHYPVPLKSPLIRTNNGLGSFKPLYK